MSEPQAFVFLSYSHADIEFVKRLRTDLEAQEIRVWVDKADLQPGTAEWDEAIRMAVRASHAVVLIASPNARSSRYVKGELRVAEMYQRPVYPIWAAGTQWIEAVPLISLSGIQYIDARENRYQSALPEIVRVLHTSLSEASGQLPTLPEVALEPRNPYKGLRAFTRADAYDFFGRDDLIEQLIESLKASLPSDRSRVEQARLLAVVGPSGSGKSSVVLAGLLPRLQQGAVPGSEEWIYLDPITPGNHPLETLTLALARHLPDRGLKSLREDLEDDSARGLHLLAMMLTTSPKQQVVLVVDQFEELFTQTASEDERQQMIDILVTGVTEPGGPMIVILTLRADFSDRPMHYPDLYPLIEAHQRTILPMQMQELRAAIEQPAALPDVRVTFEGDLVGDLLFEMQGQLGALPLLQFTLDQLFQRRYGHTLTLAAYREMGGVKGALAKHAEETYAALPTKEHQTLARSLFLRLIDPGRTEQDTTRRRAMLIEFELADPTQTKQLRETMDAFIAARLLTTNEYASVSTVEVSHEALIREWPLLTAWLREAREDIYLQQKVSEDAAAWQQRCRPNDRLYRGSQLKEARAWARRNTTSQQERTFLRTSVKQHTRFVVSMIAIVLLLFATTGIATWVWLFDPRSPDLTIVTTTQNDGVGSLRWAINNAPSGKTITFAPNLLGQTIMLTDTLFIPGKNFHIQGPAVRMLTINNAAHSIEVDLGASITLSDLVITGGKGNRRSLLNNQGTLMLTNSIVSNNASISTQGFFNGGGGISNDGTLTLLNSTVSDNSSRNGSGGIQNDGTLTLTNSTVSDNVAYNSFGGGIQNDGTLTLFNSTVSNNIAHLPGGGIYNYSSGKVFLLESTVSNNSALNGSGGGGIENDQGGTITLLNSTISDNSAQYDGGGIGNYGGIVVLTFCTLFGNSASEGGGIATQDIPYEIPEQYGRSVVQDSLIAGNHAARYPDVKGNFISKGYNLVQHSSGVPLQPTDISGDPRVDPILQLNGGSTQTHALLPGSPAIDAIPPSECRIISNGVFNTTDQRGQKRPQGTGCDIGAYEYVPVGRLSAAFT